MSKYRMLRVAAIGGGALGLFAVAALLVVVRFSLPVDDGVSVAPGLTAAVEIEFDAHHVPRIRAENRRDAYEALGYATARDRLFQMDVNRRSALGRLAEVVGASAAKADMQSRILGLERVASAVVANLPADQREVLAAYSAGVNRAVEEMRLLPLEFMLLAYRPDPWRPEDCVLVLLAMSAQMSHRTAQERTATIMRRALPAEVVDFLTPEGNCYNEMLAPREPLRCSPDAAAPFDQLAALLRETQQKKKISGLVKASETPQGSNGWVVARQKTSDGRAIMANDTHLSLTTPGVWYRAELRYGPYHLLGLTLPGAPLVVSGSNGRLAWGLTNVQGDFTDLVRIEQAADSSKYLTPRGELPFLTRSETIDVRGAPAQELVVRETIWGPLSSDKLLGEDVAIHWTGLDSATTNFDLIDMDRIAGVREALPLLHRAGGPPLNVLLADDAGGIGWTIMGRLPKRVGMDGQISESWANGEKGWRDYYSSAETPSIVDPPSGFLVNANNGMLDSTRFGPKIGHDFSGGFRAWRANEWLRGASNVDEREMLALQLDTTTQFYSYYLDVALRALDGRRGDDALKLRRYLESWDGRAEIDSLGLPLIVEFRNALIEAVISPIMARCVELDPAFKYAWSGVDIPVQRMIESGRDDLLPDRGADKDWSSFVFSTLERSARRLAERHGVASIDRLTWGRVSRAAAPHLLLGDASILGLLFNMSDAPLPGCSQCVRLAGVRYGASARMVVSPNHEEDGILELPAGQSGQFGSPYYADQHAGWLAGLPAKLLAGATVHKVILVPGAASR